MKKIVLILIAAIILSVSVISCSDNNTGSDNTTSANKNDTNDNNIETNESETTELQPDLPDTDFGGETINFLVRGEQVQPTNFSHEIYAEMENGEPINDAVYRRNKYVEELYNVVITETNTDDSVENVTKSVMSGDGEYDIAMVRPNRVITLAQGGYLTNLKEVPYIDLSQPWWDQNAVRSLAILDKLYFVTGDINIMDNNAIWITMFNKNMFDNLSLDYPYALVENGEWTLDKLIEYAMLGGNDLNGDGLYDEFDQYGLIYACENTFPLVTASGHKLTDTSKKDTITMDLNIDGIHSTLDKIVNIVNNKSVTLLCEDYTNKYSNAWSEVMRFSFREGRGMLYITGILSATYLRDMENEFGIIPLPKADVKQTNYYSWMNQNNGSTFAIPTGNDNPEMIGIISEALAAESMYTLTPAYYETTLSDKVSRDEDSVKMLDIILNSVVFDFANIYNAGDINGIFTSITKNGVNNFASAYAAIEIKAQTRIDELIEIYSQID